MLGFVSALSSTLAIIVLIASVTLVNLVTFSIKKKQTEYYTKITEPQLESGGENGLGKGNRSQGEPVFYEHVNNSLLSVEDLPPRNLAIPLIKVQCTYGNNFNFEVASKLATLNYIILKKYYDGTDVKIMLEKPLIDEATTNSCNIIQGK